MKIDQSNVYLKEHGRVFAMSNYWTDCLGNGENMSFFFYFIKLKINISIIMTCSKQVRLQKIGVGGA